MSDKMVLYLYTLHRSNWSIVFWTISGHETIFCHDAMCANISIQSLTVIIDIRWMLALFLRSHFRLFFGTIIYIINQSDFRYLPLFSLMLWLKKQKYVVVSIVTSKYETLWKIRLYFLEFVNLPTEFYPNRMKNEIVYN